MISPIFFLFAERTTKEIIKTAITKSIRRRKKSRRFIIVHHFILKIKYFMRMDLGLFNNT